MWLCGEPLVENKRDQNCGVQQLQVCSYRSGTHSSGSPPPCPAGDEEPAVEDAQRHLGAHDRRRLPPGIPVLCRRCTIVSRQAQLSDAPTPLDCTTASRQLAPPQAHTRPNTTHRPPASPSRTAAAAGGRARGAWGRKWPAAGQEGGRRQERANVSMLRTVAQPWAAARKHQGVQAPGCPALGNAHPIQEVEGSVAARELAAGDQEEGVPLNEAVLQREGRVVFSRRGCQGACARQRSRAAAGPHVCMPAARLLLFPAPCMCSAPAAGASAGFAAAGR